MIGRTVASLTAHVLVTSGGFATTTQFQDSPVHSYFGTDTLSSWNAVIFAFVFPTHEAYAFHGHQSG